MPAVPSFLPSRQVTVDGGRRLSDISGVRGSVRPTDGRPRDGDTPGGYHNRETGAREGDDTTRGDVWSYVLTMGRVSRLESRSRV